jgi:hypothetical protein
MSHPADPIICEFQAVLAEVLRRHGPDNAEVIMDGGAAAGYRFTWTSNGSQCERWYIDERSASPAARAAPHIQIVPHALMGQTHAIWNSA